MPLQNSPDFNLIGEQQHFFMCVLHIYQKTIIKIKTILERLATIYLKFNNN